MLIKILINGREFEANFRFHNESTLEDFKSFLRQELDIRGYDAAAAIFALRDFPNGNLDEETDNDFLDDFKDHYTQIIVSNAQLKPIPQTPNTVQPVSDEATGDSDEDDINPFVTSDAHADDEKHLTLPSSYHSMRSYLKSSRNSEPPQVGSVHSAASADEDQPADSDNDKTDAKASHPISGGYQHNSTLAIAIPVSNPTNDLDDLDAGYESSDHDGGISPSDTDDSTPEATESIVPTLKTMAAPNQDQLSTRIMTSRLNKIAYQPLPIAQPVVHPTPTSKGFVKAAIPLDAAPTETKINAFKQALNNDPLLALYTKLNDLLGYCTQNEWGGLRQRVPTGIAIIKKWLNHWVNSNDPKAAALDILKNIGTESETRQQGAKNFLKELLHGRDPFIGKSYSVLKRLKNITPKNSNSELTFVTTEISNLISEQQKELIAAGVAENQLPSKKIK